MNVRQKRIIAVLLTICMLNPFGIFMDKAYAGEAISESPKVTGSQDTSEQITDSQTSDNQTKDNQTADNQIADNQIADSQISGNQTEDNQTANSQSSDGQTAGSQTTEELHTNTTGEQEEKQEEKQDYTGKILLSEKKLTIPEGKSRKLQVTLTKENLSGDDILFKSSNKKIITVTPKGTIKAVHWGEAAVTVTLGKAKAVCNVTVTKDVKITISAAGDCTFSSDIKQPASINFFSVYQKMKDDTYFFKNVKSIFEKDDMTIVNFEGTLSSRGSRVDKKWAFRGKPSYINILKKSSIESVAFANNHVRDYGEVSYTDTIESFEKADIAYSSYSKIGVFEAKGLRIGMISIQEVGMNNAAVTLRKAIKSMKKKKPDLLIVSFHWGIERTSALTKTQVDLSRIAIDEGGADLVLGHHPHVLQPIEKYKDAYIVYSLGNFCFGGNTNPPDKDTMIYQQTFSFHNDKLIPDDEVRIIPCSVSSVSSRNNYQPTPSKGSEKSRILKRINQYCKKFGISFDKNGTVNGKKK